ncbi:hypothetical protein B0H14DRAFT_3709849 [Mycena olivaceomarginata]|nr:hypothetical protein B0H14DRAFT_3709849 [Mycena olivaceomarginata]
MSEETHVHIRTWVCRVDPSSPHLTQITDSLCRTADESFRIKEEEERSTREEPEYPRLGRLPTWFWQQNQRRESPTCSTESWSYGPSDAAATYRPYYESSHSGQPRDSNRPVPLGNPKPTPTQTGRASFWSTVGVSRVEASASGSATIAERDATVFSPMNPLGSTAHRDISPDEFARLSEQFEFIEEHDEHADVAAGDQLIDESLGDNIPDSAESNAAAAEAETQSSEPAPSSVIHKQLTAIQERLLEEETTHGKPLCYLRVFVWLPYLLPGCPDRFKCTCGKPLSKNGFNDNPIARRVRAMPSDFFLFTNRFICDSRRFLKHMGGMKGEHVFTAAYTVLNEFEEVRAHSLTLTKSLLFVKDMFDGIQRGLKDSNNPPTEILYTDSPQWVVTVSISDSMGIESMSNDILIDVGAADLSSQLYLVALAIKTEQLPGERVRLDVIQLRTKDKIYVFKVTALTSRSHTSRSHVLPSLRAILTNPSIIKIGHSICQTLETIAEAFSLPEINKIVKAKNAPILKLGKYAKLKGVVDDPTVSLHALAGAVLRNSFLIPHFSPYPWSHSTSLVQDEFLFKEVDCLWQISLSLHCRNSLGLPLQPAQAQTHGQLVTLVHGCKPVAEGSIVGHHPGYLDAVMDDEGHTKRINISASRSLIEISKVHFIHCTRIQWSGLLPMEPKLSSPHPSFTLGVMLLQFHPILLLACMLFQHR